MLTNPLFLFIYYTSIHGAATAFQLFLKDWGLLVWNQRFIKARFAISLRDERCTRDINPKINKRLERQQAFSHKAEHHCNLVSNSRPSFLIKLERKLLFSYLIQYVGHRQLAFRKHWSFSRVTIICRWKWRPNRWKRGVLARQRRRGDDTHT